MRLLAATLAVAGLAVVAASSSTAAPTRVAKLTAAEQKWVSPVIKIWNAMNADLSVVGKQTTAADGMALIPGTAQNKVLVTTLGDFVTCTMAMNKAKAPPTARLQPFATSMKTACKFLADGAHGVAGGIAKINKNKVKLGTQQITAAFGEFKKGSAKLATARRQLLAIGGKNVFSGHQ